MNLRKRAKLALFVRGVISAAAAASVLSGTAAMAVDDLGSVSESVMELSYVSTVTETETIPRGIIRRANSGLPKGETVTIEEGVDGVKEVEYKIVYDGGVEVSRTALSSKVVSESRDKVIEYGTAEDGGETKDFEYKYVVECLATAYDPSPEENGGYAGQSATGVPLQKGVIAVDPRVIPLGSRVYVEAVDGSWSYGYAVAADTGGAIKGNRVDLLFLTKSECYQFGRRKCRVYVL